MAASEAQLKQSGDLIVRIPWGRAAKKRRSRARIAREKALSRRGIKS
jgi:hypothetical protein